MINMNDQVAILEVRHQARVNLTAVKVGDLSGALLLSLMIKMTQILGSLGPHSDRTRSSLLQDVSCIFKLAEDIFALSLPDRE